MADRYALQKILGKSKLFIERNSPTILTSIGAVGVVATSILTAKATIKAMDIVAAAKEEKKEELTKKEIIKGTWKAYIPAAVVGVSTITCIFGANAINKRRQKALIEAYKMLDQSYKEYKAKVIELYGEEADKKVKREIAKDRYEEYPDKKPKNGLQLFYDDYSKRYFHSTLEDVQRAEYRLNRNLVVKDYAYLNEWYELIGLEPLDNRKAGWSMGMCMDYYWQSWIDFSHDKTIMNDGTECTIIYILEEPVLDFENYC